MYQKRIERKNKPMKATEANINWYPGHMAKAKRLIKAKLPNIDIVIEVLDARIPYSSKLKDIDEIVKAKPVILVMTKADLCDYKETNKWVQAYQKDGYQVILTDLNHDNNITKKVTIMVQSLMKETNLARKQHGLLPKKAHVLIIGIPNVGKSTLINRLVHRKATNVGNKPGITKDLTWIRISDAFELLDTPGILWPKLDDAKVALNLATFTAIKETILPLDKVATYVIEMLYHYYPNVLKKKYKVEKYDNIKEAFDLIIANFHYAPCDYDRVYHLIIDDIKTGKVKGLTFDRYNDGC